MVYIQLQKKAKGMGYLTLDSPGYLEPAVYLMKGHIFEAVSLIRPTGYPAFRAPVKSWPDRYLDVLTIVPNSPSAVGITSRDNCHSANIN